MSNMSREKKSQVDDVTKLRRILDNSSDPSLKYLISKDDYVLESVRRRLSDDFYQSRPFVQRYYRPSESLEPRVSIRGKNPVIPPLITPLPKLEPTIPLPEFELISQSTSIPIVPSPEITFEDKELFEVEKIDHSIPEFLEVTQKETTQAPQDDQIIYDDELSQPEKNLPQWQLVEEEQTTESSEVVPGPTTEDAPEFEPITTIAAPESTPEPERPIEWESVPQEKEQVKPDIDFLPTEPDNKPFQMLTKKQEHTAKKEQRKKEKEEKKLKKMELKRIKKEKQEEERKTKLTSQEPSEKTEPIEETEPPQFNVDYDKFNGIKSIDKKTAEHLYKNGYFSVENIKEATIDDLVQIHGIKRKLAKRIKKEVEEQTLETTPSEFVPIKQKATKKKDKKRIQDSTEWESSTSKEKTPKSSDRDICIYMGYTLYQRESKMPSGKKSTVHYFSKSKSDGGHPSPLPEGYRIALNKKTGVPYLKKK